MTQMGPGNWFITSCIINEFENFNSKRGHVCGSGTPRGVIIRAWYRDGDWL